MRIVEVDAIKGVAIVGVTFAHIAFEGRLEPHTLEITRYAQLVLGWCVIAFFWASGFLFKKNPKNIDDIRNFVKSRFVRLIIPCVIFSISYKLILSVLFLTGRFSWESPVPSNVTEIIQFLFNPVGPQFYFLYYLFVVSCIFSFLNVFLSSNKIFTLSALLFPVAFEFIEMPRLGYGSDYNLIPFYFFAYVAGNYFSCLSSRNNTRFFLLLVTSITITSIVNSAFTPFYIVVPFVLQRLFMWAPRLTKIIDKTTLGKFSSGIYVWHAPIILPFVSIVCVKLIGGNPIVIVPMIIITLIISISISWMTHKFSWLKLWRF